MSHETPDSPSAFLIRYLDDHFSQMEARVMARIDDVKALVAEIQTSLDAADGRDAEDVAEWKRKADELQARLDAGDADLAALQPELQALKDRIAAHDLDPNFPAKAPDGGGAPPPDAGPVPA
jgi:peptidoglycan hydrolase CwlO-like protein